MKKKQNDNINIGDFVYFIGQRSGIRYVGCVVGFEGKTLTKIKCFNEIPSKYWATAPINNIVTSDNNLVHKTTETQAYLWLLES